MPGWRTETDTSGRGEAGRGVFPRFFPAVIVTFGLNVISQSKETKKLSTNERTEHIERFFLKYGTHLPNHNIYHNYNKYEKLRIRNFVK